MGSRRAPGDLRQRLRDAWALSRPPAYGIAAQEEAHQLDEEARVGPLERAQEAVCSAFYFATFAAIVVSVFFRFVLDRPLVWSIEVPTYLFFWCFCLAAGLSDWRDRQITFDLLADRMPARLRLAAGAATNLLIIVPFALVLPGTIAYLRSESVQPTTGLPITEVWGFAGVLPLFVIAILLRGRLLVRQLAELGLLSRRRGGR